MAKEEENKKLKEELASQVLEASKLKDEKKEVEAEIQKFEQVQKSLTETSHEKE